MRLAHACLTGGHDEVNAGVEAERGAVEHQVAQAGVQRVHALHALPDASLGGPPSSTCSTRAGLGDDAGPVAPGVQGWMVTTSVVITSRTRLLIDPPRFDLRLRGAGLPTAASQYR